MIKQIYLDSAATSIIEPKVLDLMIKSYEYDYGNPSSIHMPGQLTRAKIEQIREDIASKLRVNYDEIIFTSGGTEANNYIIRHAIRELNIERIISSELEHNSVYKTILDLQKTNPNLEICFLPVKEKGVLDLEKLEDLLKDTSKTTLVSLMHSNNEFGNLLDLESITKKAKEYGAFVHSDTVQSMAHLDLDFSKIPLDFASNSAHKYHGPKGIGFAFIRKNTGIKNSMITGGGQEKGLRSGTENVQGIIGLGKAFTLALDELEARKQSISELKKYTIDKLKEKYPTVKFNGLCDDFNNSMYNLLSVMLPFPNYHLIGAKLNDSGIFVSQGSACSSKADDPSYKMSYLYPFEVIKNSTALRISFSHFNTKEDIDTFITILNQITDQI